MDWSIILSILLLVALCFMFWYMWHIHRLLKEIKHSLDHLETGVALLSDQLTIMLYLEIKNSPELLAKSPGLEQRALEAAERLGRKQLTAPGGPDG